MHDLQQTNQTHKKRKELQKIIPIITGPYHTQPPNASTMNDEKIDKLNWHN
jgi:hypothetical protein